MNEPGDAKKNAFQMPKIHKSLVETIKNTGKRGAERSKHPIGFRKFVDIALELVEGEEGAPKAENQGSKSGGSQMDAKLQKPKFTPAVDIYSIRFSPQGQELAIGCTDGSVRLYNPESHKLVKCLNVTKDAAPTTCVRYRPLLPSSSKKTGRVLLCSNAAGHIQYWHVPSGKKIFQIHEKDNKILALDYSRDAQYFASAGEDKTVRIYEETTKSLLLDLKMGVGSNSSEGHSMRVMCVKFHPNDNNLLFSAGWDDIVRVWDVRAGKTVRRIEGPHVCGDALDVAEDCVLTGSWRTTEGLQVWDLGSGKLIQDIDFHSKDNKKKEGDFLYAAQFSHDASLIAAGGSFVNETRVFDVKRGFKRIDQMKTKAKNIYALHFSPDGQRLASGSGSGHLSIMELNNDEDD